MKLNLIHYFQRSEKAKDMLSSNEVFTMDLQSVLLCPKSNVSSLYYKTKLAVHNSSVYDIKRHQGYYYLWNESEGTLGSNEFSTIIVSFISNFIDSHPSENNVEYIVWLHLSEPQRRVVQCIG